MKNKNPRWKSYPSPKAVRTFLDNQVLRPALLTFSRSDLEHELGERGQDYLDEVAFQASLGCGLVVVIREEYRDQAIDDMRSNDVRGLYIVDDSMLDGVQNAEQTFHKRMTRLVNIPDDGNLGELYLRDINRRGYTKDGQSKERAHWTVEPVVKVGTKNIEVPYKRVFHKVTGHQVGDFDHIQAYFSCQAMEDVIFANETRHLIVDKVRTANIQTLRKVAALLGVT